MPSPDPAPRHAWLRPSIAAGLGAWLLYTVVVNAVQASAGIPYPDWFKTAANAWRTGVLSLVAGSALLTVLALTLRWDGLWRDPARLGTTKVIQAAMILWAVIVAVRLAGIRWGDVPPDLLLAIVVSGVLVGFAEEILFRGMLLRCLREGGRAESSAAIWTAVCFGFFHLPNVFMGAGAAGLLQVLMAALSGAVLYAFRRHYGVIGPAMVAHGAWDISAFLAGGYAAPWLALPSLVMQALILVAGVAVLVSVYRNDRNTVVMPAVGH